MTKQKKKVAANSEQLHYVSNMAVLEAEATSAHQVEYQVFTDAHVTGECEYGPYKLQIWEFGHKRMGDQQLLCLRFPDAITDQLGRTKGKSAPERIYHGGGVGSELTALASVFLRARFSLGAMVRYDDIPLMLPRKLINWIDPQLVEDERPLSDLSYWLEQVASLTPTLQKRFIFSARLYQQGLELMEEKPDLAYLNLISAIEVLSQDFAVDGLIDSEDDELAGLLNQMSDSDLRSDLREEIERVLLNCQTRFNRQTRSISLKFRKFILAHIEPSFWQRRKPRPDHDALEPVQTSLQITSETLEMWLKKIYDQRSRTLHSGEAFPPTTFAPLLQDLGAEFSPEITVNGRTWLQKEMVPYPQFFERLVNHVLRTYLSRHLPDIQTTSMQSLHEQPKS